MLSRLATPAFLVIAGFLFFRDGPVSLEQYRRKLKSRFYTLVLPYLAWNSIAILLFWAWSALDQILPAPAAAPCYPCNFKALAKGFVGWPVYPADAPLWFVRDFLLLVAVAPLLGRVPKRLQLLGIAVVGLYWLTGPQLDLLPGGIPRAGSVFFVLAGAWLGINRIALKQGPAINKVMLLAATVFLASAALGASCATAGADHATAKTLLEKMVRVSGAVLVGCAALKPARLSRLSGMQLKLSAASFFLFASHYCVLACLSGLVTRIPKLNLGAACEPILFGATFVTAVIVSLGWYFLLKRYAPSLLSLLDGNRSARGPRAGSPANQPERLPLPISPRHAPSFR